MSFLSENEVLLMKKFITYCLAPIYLLVYFFFCFTHYNIYDINTIHDFWRS